ncbi:MAG: OmpH family outer membrane protein [Desulfovibrio sp.]|jgi:Skp family chaperone for outer membrane proteins|nr:OmpH family outer membrane protein [Desulfovibrio sp.]
MRTLIALAACLLLASTAVAQQTEIKIAIFNLQKVVTESDVLKDAQAAIKKDFDPRKSSLEKENASLQKLAETLRSGKPTEQQRKDFMAKQQAYSKKTNEFVTDFQKAEMRVRSDVDRVILAAAETYARKKGYDLILDNAAAIYAGGLTDVTSDMLSETNAQWRSMKKK